MGVVWKHLNSKRIYNLVNFTDFRKGVCKKWTCHTLSPKKDACNILGTVGSPVTTHKSKKNVSNLLHGSNTRTVTNCQAHITKCEMRSRHSRQWNLKKTKSSKCSKLEEIFNHIDCFEVLIKVENPLPAFSTTINLLDARMIRLTWKNLDYLSFSLSSLEFKHSVVYNYVNEWLFYKRFMQFFSKAFENALVLWTGLWTTSIRLWLCKVRRIFFIFDIFYFLLYTVEVTVTQSQ